jgi:hypothetical protein
MSNNNNTNSINSSHNSCSSPSHPGSIDPSSRYGGGGSFISGGSSSKTYTRSNSSVTITNSCCSSNNSNSNGPSRTNSVYGSSSGSKFVLGAVPKRPNNSKSFKNGNSSNHHVGCNSNGTLIEMGEDKALICQGSTSTQGSSYGNNEDGRESQKSKSALSSDSGMVVSEPGFVGGSCMSSPTIEDEDNVHKKEHRDSESSTQFNCRPPVDTSFDGRKGGEVYALAGTRHQSITSPTNSGYFGESTSTANFVGAETPNSGMSRSNSLRLNPNSPTSPSALPMKQLQYPFRHVNDMTIIENKTYDLAD